MSEFYIASDSGHPAFMQALGGPHVDFPIACCVDLIHEDIFPYLVTCASIRFSYKKTSYLSFLTSIRRDGLMRTSCCTAL